MEIAALTLLHALVLVYWLGGDLGAFVASFRVTDTGASPQARLAAAGLVGDVDMAPRSALILAGPTGFALAQAKDWIEAPAWAAPALWLAALAWLALAWRQHLAHATPTSLGARIDTGIRVAAIGALAVAAFAPLPLFLRVKCALLAGAIVAGLAIRRLLKPFGPALAGLVTGAPTPAQNAAIALSLGRARVAVLVIWTLILAAAWFGVATPV